MGSVLVHRDFRLFWAGGVLSVAGDWMLLTALPFYVWALTGSAVATSAMYVAYAVPRLLLGMLGGTLADRFDRRRTMIVCDLARALFLLPLLVADARSVLWLLLAVSAVQSTVGQLFFPARNALLPALVPADQRIQANALDTFSMGITRLVGPIGGGAVLAGLGIDAVIVIDASTFCLSALLMWRMRAPLAIAGRRRPRPLAGVRADLVAGLRMCARTVALRWILLLSGLVMIGYGLVSVLTVAFVQAELGGSAAHFGWVLAAQGLGLTVGGLLGSRLGAVLRPAWCYSGGLVVTGGCLFVMFDATSLGVVLLFAGLSGLGLSAWMVGERTVLQSVVGSRLLGRAFGAYGTVTGVLMLLGTTLAAVLATAWGVRTTLLLASLLYLVPGLVGAWVIVSRRTRAVADVEEDRAAA